MAVITFVFVIVENLDVHKVPIKVGPVGSRRIMGPPLSPVSKTAGDGKVTNSYSVSPMTVPSMRGEMVTRALWRFRPFIGPQPEG